MPASETLVFNQGSTDVLVFRDGGADDSPIFSLRLDTMYDVEVAQFFASELLAFAAALVEMVAKEESRARK